MVGIGCRAQVPEYNSLVRMLTLVTIARLSLL
jgi:hypothetical protein